MASSVPNAGTALEQAKIAGVRQAWLQAVRDGDVNRLANFVTDDVVAVLKGQLLRQGGAKTGGAYVGKRI